MAEIDPVVSGDVIEADWGNAVSTHDHSGAGSVPVPHASTSGKTANDHHNQSHAHNGADGSGTVAHSATTGIGIDDHHARDHHARHEAGGADAMAADAAAGTASLRSLGTTATTAAAGNHAHTPDIAEDADIQSVGTANAAGANNTEFAMAAHVHKGDWDAVVTKGANEDVTNSAALQDDDALQFATDASKAYYIEIYLAYELQSGSAADLKVAVGEDASVRGAFEYLGVSAAEAAQEGAIAADQTATVAFGGTANLRLAILRGTYRGNGGTFKVRWAQNTATAGVYTRVRSGSFLRYRTFG